jgi:hypothetical protein
MSILVVRCFDDKDILDQETELSKQLGLVQGAVIDTNLLPEGVFVQVEGMSVEELDFHARQLQYFKELRNEPDVWETDGLPIQGEA